jgi:hypothetical protein
MVLSKSSKYGTKILSGLYHAVADSYRCSCHEQESFFVEGFCYQSFSLFPSLAPLSCYRDIYLEVRKTKNVSTLKCAL